jgi:hypothetical protein
MTRRIQKRRTIISRLLSGVIAGKRLTRENHWLVDELPS